MKENVNIDQKSELRGSQSGGEGGGGGDGEKFIASFFTYPSSLFFNVGDLEISKGV